MSPHTSLNMSEAATQIPEGYTEVSHINETLPNPFWTRKEDITIGDTQGGIMTW
jgi:hypothetical protein